MTENSFKLDWYLFEYKKDFYVGKNIIRIVCSFAVTKRETCYSIFINHLFNNMELYNYNLNINELSYLIPILINKNDFERVIDYGLKTKFNTFGCSFFGDNIIFQIKKYKNPLLNPVSLNWLKYDIDICNTEEPII